MRTPPLILIALLTACADSTSNNSVLGVLDSQLVDPSDHLVESNWNDTNAPRSDRTGALAQHDVILVPGHIEKIGPITWEYTGKARVATPEELEAASAPYEITPEPEPNPNETVEEQLLNMVRIDVDLSMWRAIEIDEGSAERASNEYLSTFPLHPFQPINGSGTSALFQEPEFPPLPAPDLDPTEGLVSPDSGFQNIYCKPDGTVGNWTSLGATRRNIWMDSPWATFSDGPNRGEIQYHFAGIYSELFNHLNTLYYEPDEGGSAVYIHSQLVKPDKGNYTDLNTGPVEYGTVSNGLVVPVALSGQCSGTLIGPDLVLTAAHCLLVSEGVSTFTPKTTRICTDGNRQHSFSTGLPFLGTLKNTPQCVGIKKIAISPYYSMTRAYWRDWALIRLDAPLIDIQPAFISYREPRNLGNKRISLIGYPSVPIKRTDTLMCEERNYYGEGHEKNYWSIYQTKPFSPFSREGMVTPHYKKSSNRHLADGTLFRTSTRGIQVSVSHGQGYSGAGYHFSYPFGRIRVPFIMGVHAVHFYGNDHAAGPKSSYWANHWLDAATGI